MILSLSASDEAQKGLTITENGSLPCFLQVGFPFIPSLSRYIALNRYNKGQTSVLAVARMDPQTAKSGGMTRHVRVLTDRKNWRLRYAYHEPLD